MNVKTIPAYPVRVNDAKKKASPGASRGHPILPNLSYIRLTFWTWPHTQHLTFLFFLDIWDCESQQKQRLRFVLVKVFVFLAKI